MVFVSTRVPSIQPEANEIQAGKHRSIFGKRMVVVD